MRWKYERENLPAYRCCFCCHLRTGTLILGLILLLVQVLSISLVGVFVMRPELLNAFLCTEEPAVPSVSTTVPNATTAGWPLRPNPLLFSMKDLDHDDLVVTILFLLGMMSVTLCLIYGTILGRPKYITPFFCVQVFDMCITGMAMLSYFSSIQELKRFISMQPCLPGRQFLSDLDDNNLMALTLVAFVAVLFFKMYFIGVVWTCYKYLQQFALRMNGTADGNVRRYNMDVLDNADDTEMLLPPKYEDVIAMPPAAEQAPPPPAYRELDAEEQH
jgi:lysosomal-associated transmembrane protein